MEILYVNQKAWIYRPRIVRLDSGLVIDYFLLIYI